jgi:hypothetical protein
MIDMPELHRAKAAGAKGKAHDREMGRPEGHRDLLIRTVSSNYPCVNQFFKLEKLIAGLPSIELGDPACPKLIL